ncbi:MAG: nucleoside deaminase [Candidatus Cloacimonas sp.]
MICFSEQDHYIFMKEALLEAKIAAQEDEIPVGGVLVKDGNIVLREHNRSRQLANPLAHCEKLLIDKILASEPGFLYDYTLYVTLEPCLMCAGMIILSKMGTIVYGAKDPKAGVVGSIYNVLKDKSFNHHPTVVSGILADECSSLLKDFFSIKRKL